MNNDPVLDALGALAQKTRLSIFRLLVVAGREGLTPGKIAQQLELAPATLSFHLKQLSHAQLITPRQESRFIIYTANLEAIQDLVGYLVANCCGDVLVDSTTSTRRVAGDPRRNECIAGQVVEQPNFGRRHEGRV